MSVHALLNLLNKLGISDKMRGLSSILSLFRNEFNTGAQMLDSIYHMTLTLLKITFLREIVKILSLLRNVKINIIT